MLLKLKKLISNLNKSLDRRENDGLERGWGQQPRTPESRYVVAELIDLMAKSFPGLKTCVLRLKVPTGC